MGSVQTRQELRVGWLWVGVGGRVWVAPSLSKFRGECEWFLPYAELQLLIRLLRMYSTELSLADNNQLRNR